MIADIEQGIEIASSRKRVWAVLTGEGLVEEWLGCMNYRAEVGHVFYMQPDPARRSAGDIDGATHCKLLALDPPRRMVFSWYFPDTPATTVEILVNPLGPGRTRVDLLHSGWDQFDDDQIRAIRDSLEGGWSSYVLPNLKRAAEA